MKTSLTKGLDKDASKEIENAFGASALLRKRYSEVLKDKIEVSAKEDCAKDAYNCPNWAYKQADSQGYRRAIREVLSLLE